MKNKFTVRDLPVEDRPRERLFKLGAEALSLQELLCLILGRGTRAEPVTDIAHNLIRYFGNLQNMANASISELSNLKGIGPAKATQLKAAFELAKRLNNTTSNNIKTAIKNPQDVIKAVSSRLKDKKKEHFLLLSLDTRNQLIDIQTISIGSIDCSVVHPREVFKAAITDLATSIILVHNHPSGIPEPSEEDIKLTRRLLEVSKIMDIQILDHIIMGNDSYFSMKEKGIF